MQGENTDTDRTRAKPGAAADGAPASPQVASRYGTPIFAGVVSGILCGAADSLVEAAAVSSDTMLAAIIITLAPVAIGGIVAILGAVTARSWINGALWSGSFWAAQLLGLHIIMMRGQATVGFGPTFVGSVAMEAAAWFAAGAMICGLARICLWKLGPQEHLRVIQDWFQRLFYARSRRFMIGRLAGCLIAISMLVPVLAISPPPKGHEAVRQHGVPALARFGEKMPALACLPNGVERPAMGVRVDLEAASEHVLIIVEIGGEEGGTELQLQLAKVLSKRGGSISYSLGRPKVLCNLNHDQSLTLLEAGIPSELVKAMLDAGRGVSWRMWKQSDRSPDHYLDPTPFFTDEYEALQDAD